MPDGEWEFSHARDEYESETGIVGYRGYHPEEHKWFGHMPAARIKALVGDSVWDSYFKFCVVRNPFDKAVSAFHYFERRQDEYTGIDKLKAKIERLLQGSSSVKRFRRWLADGRFYDDSDKYMIDGKVAVDYFIRYEDLSGGVEHVCQKLDLPFEPDRLPRLLSGIRPEGKDLSSYFDEKSIDIITHKYAWQLDRFGYRPPSPRD
jgi:hypothetical protein